VLTTSQILNLTPFSSIDSTLSWHHHSAT